MHPEREQDIRVPQVNWGVQEELRVVYRGIINQLYDQRAPCRLRLLTPHNKIKRAAVGQREGRLQEKTMRAGTTYGTT